MSKSLTKVEIADENYYSINETAGFLEVTPQTVLKYLNAGNLAGEQRGPKKKWFISGSEIKRKMKEWKVIK